MREYSVINRDGGWWIVKGGDRHGPYSDMLIAERAAIVSAKQDFKNGLPARVTVHQDGLHVVYDSISQALPGDAVPGATNSALQEAVTRELDKLSASLGGLFDPVPLRDVLVDELGVSKTDALAAIEDEAKLRGLQIISF